MNKTIVIAAAFASATLFAGAASANGHGSSYGSNHNSNQGYGQSKPSAPAISANVGAKVAPLNTAIGVGATVGGRNGLLDVQTGIHTPLANIGLGVQAGGGHGELLSLDLGAFSGGVGR